MKQFIVVLSVAIGLTACASNQVINLAQGSDDATALIQSSETVAFKYIDDEPVKSEFIGQQYVYRVAPGQHTVLLEYSDLFELNADEHDKLVSRPAKVTFEAERGERYQIAHDPQPNRKQAQEFAEKPDFWVMNVSSGKKVESLVELSRPRTFLTNLRSSMTPEYEFESDRVASSSGAKEQLAEAGSTSNPSSAPETPFLESLQQLWQSAPKAERDAFLHWVKDNQ